jgi:hypothetical protein
VVAALRHVAAREGLAALWKGNGVTIVHRLPYSAANFWVYEHVNELWKTHVQASQGAWAPADVTRRLVAGGLAGMSACALVRGQMQGGRRRGGTPAAAVLPHAPRRCCWLGALQNLLPL